MRTNRKASKISADENYYVRSIINNNIYMEFIKKILKIKKTKNTKKSFHKPAASRTGWLGCVYPPVNHLLEVPVHR